MKKLFILCLILFSCAGLQVQEPLDIHVSEVEGSVAISCMPINPYIVFCVSMVRGTVVVSQVWFPTSLTMRYTYVDSDGKVRGFCFDIDVWEEKKELEYNKDTFDADEEKYIRDVTDRVNRGIELPLMESKPESESERDSV